MNKKPTRKFKTVKPQYVKLACGCKMWRGIKLDYYISKIISHALKCGQAQQLLINSRKERAG